MSVRETTLANLIELMQADGLGADPTLRSLADQVGTSHRMLQYHFGTKDALLAEAIVAARQPERDRIAAQIGSRTFLEMVRELWDFYTDERQSPIHRTFVQILARAVGDPQAFAFFVTSLDEWVELIRASAIADGYEPDEAAALAQLVVSSTRGLLIDRLLVTDVPRIDAAYELLLTTISRSVR